MKIKIILGFFLVIVLSCNDETVSSLDADVSNVDTFKIYTSYSNLDNTYSGFNSPNAINKVADIENEYFNNYEKSYSKYYGTFWHEMVSFDTLENDSISVFDRYKMELSKFGKEADSMHCTIYAVEALKAGLDTNFDKLQLIHEKIWNNREFAGWSIGYILVTEFGWSAYLILSDFYQSYDVCMKNYKLYKKYDVWRQPDIPIVQVFNFYDDRIKIDSLLKENEFGWGFSDQGMHTWITRFDTLKECRWEGVPSKFLSHEYAAPLFKSTKFIEFYDYASHVVIFPPKYK
ncbi:MAG: hypothetical protein JXL97_01820 [Bacteroidales bacterium]|nr:hypothetical protein [Bacteroidales bacterium]